MIRTGWLAALLLTIAPWTCLGQPGGMGGGMGGGGIPQKVAEKWTVKLETVGNQSVTGRLSLASVMVQCDLGTYEINPEKIKAIEFAAPEAGVPVIFGQFGAQRSGTVITSTGEKVSGVISVPDSWRIETDLGTLTPNARQLKTFTFVAKLPAVAHLSGPRVIISSPPVDRKPKEGGQPEKVKKPGEAPTTSPEKSS